MTSDPLILDITGLGHERFQVTLAGINGAAPIRANFEWRTEIAAFEDDLRALEILALVPEAELKRLRQPGAALVPPPDSQLALAFGQRLFRALLAGDVGDAFRQRLAADPGQAVPIVLRIDPKTAQALSRLPWELMHDGQAFLSLSRRTPIARLPAGVALSALPPIPGGLHMLVVVANPDDLDDAERLDVDAEREQLLAATDKLQRDGRLDVVFLEDASPDAIQDALADGDFHILHLTGHGSTRPDGQSMLLLENEQGGQELVTGAEFTQLLQGSGLRLVVLNACRTAALAQHAAFPDVGSQLAAAGFPAVLAMQYSVEDGAATAFAERLYRALARGQDVFAAVTRARSALLTEKTGPAAHATVVAFIADPACLQVNKTGMLSAQPNVGLADYGMMPRVERGFVARGRELRRLRRNFAAGRWRAAVVYGLGGIGKSALAGRLAGRLLELRAMDGVKVVNCTLTLTADGVLGELNAFLNLLGDNRLNAVLHQPLPLPSKAAVLAQALDAHRLLVIFDNVEDCLKDGRTVSRAAQADVAGEAVENPTAFTDPDLGRLVAQLVGSVAHGTAFLFTSRLNFEPLEAGRLAESLGHVPLGELSFVAAVQLMNRREALAGLPLRAPAGSGALDKLLLYARLGGHPWSLDQFARRAVKLSLQDALGAIGGVQKEGLGFSLVEKAAAALPERARQLLRRAGILDEPVPPNGLAFLLGDEQDAMPAVDDEIQALLGWGLLDDPPGT